MKILIVEDEYYARKRLVKMVREWDSHASITGDVETGKEAVSSMNAEEPDIVLTDIRMPEMDGLALSKYIAEQYPRTHVAILSGYADFEYAREAMKHSVKGYLLKPIKKEDLYELLDELKGSWEKRKREKQQYDLALGKLASYKNIWQLTSALYGQTSLSENLSEIFELRQEEGGFRVMVVNSFGPVTEQESESFHTLLETGIGFVNPIKKQEWVGIGLITDAPAGMKDRHCSIGVSRRYTDPDMLAQGYREARYAAAQHLLHGPGQRFEYEKLTETGGFEWVEGWESKLQQELRAGKAAAAAGLIRSVFAKFQESGQGSVRHLQQLYSKIDSILRLEMNELMTEETPKKDIEDFASIEQLIMMLSGQAERVCHSISSGELKEGESQALINDIMAYVSDNYACDISLEFLAKHRYYLNSSYLSRLFKSKTGQGFTDFLTACRMKKAKELIETNWYTVSEVAGLVGYTKPSHFIQLFKKYYGETPGSYKSALR